MRPLAIASLAVAAVLLGPPVSSTPAASAAKAKRSCMKAKGRTLAVNTGARVFTTSGGSVLWGCAVGSRPRRLARDYDDGYVSSGAVQSVELAGAYVAYGFIASDISCKAACPPDYDPTTEFLTVVNLKSRGGRSTQRWDGEPFVLTATGAAAWIAGRGTDARAVLAYFQRAVTQQDSGAIQDDSLEASRSRITWMKEGAIRGAFFG